MTMPHAPVGSAEWKSLIIEGAKALGICLNQDTADHFAVHALELLKWNRKINLTAITDPLDIAVKHFLDSIVPSLMIPQGAALLDIGSGGGFPGIPLKIIMPSLSVTLADASLKKVNFQKQVIRSLNLRNIEAVHARAEDMPRDPKFANAFDVIICRAFSALDVFAETALPLLAENGIIAALKGKLSEKEIESAHIRIGKIRFESEVKTYLLPYLGAERAMVIFKSRIFLPS